MELSELDPKKVWLNRLLKVDRKYNAQITQALKESSEDIQERILSLNGKSNISSTVRRAQLVGASGVITEVLKELFRNSIGTIILEGRSESAVEVVKAANIWDDEILRQIIEDPSKRKVFKSSLEATAKRNIGATIAKVTGESIPLSRRLYRSEAIARGQISRVINSSLVAGDSADDLAAKAKKFVSPNVPGGANYVARRLARTEINNAFHSQSIQTLQDRPWVSQVNWRLSGSHVPDPGDKCERYANVGTYPASGVPRKPHPQCLCYITPITPSIEFIMSQFDNGVYDQWLSEQTGLARAA